MSNRVITCKTSKEILGYIRSSMSRNRTIKIKQRALLVQEYERYETNPDEDLTDSYDWFLTLLNNLSLAGKEYEAEDSNTKYLRSLLEEEEVNYALVASFEETQTTDDSSTDKVQEPIYNFDIDDTYRLKSFLKSLHLSFKTKTLENTRLRS